MTMIPMRGAGRDQQMRDEQAPRPLQWEPAPGGARKGWIADTSAGRYRVKRREPRGPWIATFNGERVMLAEAHIWPNAESAMQAINRSHV